MTCQHSHKLCAECGASIFDNRLEPEPQVMPVPGYDHTVATENPPVGDPFDSTKKYEHRGLTCDKHGQQAHRRERNATGPWTCVVCSPE
jgi:hypothetical protein